MCVLKVDMVRMRVERGCAPVGVLVKLMCAGICELINRKFVSHIGPFVSANHCLPFAMQMLARFVQPNC